MAPFVSCQMLESVECSLTGWTDMYAFAIVLGDIFGGLVGWRRIPGDFDHCMDLRLSSGEESDGHGVYTVSRICRRL